MKRKLYASSLFLVLALPIAVEAAPYDSAKHILEFSCKPGSRADSTFTYEYRIYIASQAIGTDTPAVVVISNGNGLKVPAGQLVLNDGQLMRMNTQSSIPESQGKVLRGFGLLANLSSAKANKKYGFHMLFKLEFPNPSTNPSEMIVHDSFGSLIVDHGSQHYSYDSVCSSIGVNNKK